MYVVCTYLMCVYTFIWFHVPRLEHMIHGDIHEFFFVFFVFFFLAQVLIFNTCNILRRVWVYKPAQE